MAFVAASVLGGCAGSPDSSIAIDREVRLEGLHGTPQAIVRTADGSFVVAGSWGNGWAAGTTSTGIVRWRYVEPDLEQSRSPVASGFNGAVALANGEVLLCGQHHQQALVTILDEDGQLVDRRDILPPDGNAAISVSSINECFIWDDGVALVGGGADGQFRRYSWLFKLDRAARPLWGRTIEGPWFRGVTQAPDGNLILAGTLVKNNAYALQLVELDHEGQPRAQRIVDGAAWSTLLWPLGTPSAYSKVLCAAGPSDVRLLTLNRQLQDASPPVGVASVGATSAYALPDGSAAVFGVGKGRAAVGHLARPGKPDTVYVFPPPNVGGSTTSVGAAVPLSRNQFVSVRDEVSAGDPPQSRMVLSWITFH